MKDRITIKGHDGAFAAYIARPKTSPAPAALRFLKGADFDFAARLSTPSPQSLHPIVAL